MTVITAIELVAGNVVTFDGDDSFEVVKVGRGLKQRNVTYRPCGGRSDDTFTITHLPTTKVHLVRG